MLFKGLEDPMNAEGDSGLEDPVNAGGDMDINGNVLPM